MSVLEKLSVLKLNSNWQPLSVISVQDAFIAMSRLRKTRFSKGVKPPYTALNIQYPLLENGGIDTTKNMILEPVEWAEWILLPIRPQDAFVNTGKTTIRVPTVIIANNYGKIPERKARFSKHGVWERDNYTCRVTGKKLNRKNGNLDHLVSKAKGGETSYENCYAVLQEINQLKADMTPEEFERKTGFKLPKQEDLKPPKVHRKIENRYNIKDWEIFLE